MTEPKPISEPPAGCRAYIELRGAARYPSRPDADCTFQPEGADDTYHGWIVNLSQTGIGVLLEQRFPPGTRAHIRLSSRVYPHSKQLAAEVRHSEICFPNEAWLHGCAFFEALSDEEMGLLADRCSRH